MTRRIKSLKRLAAILALALLASACSGSASFSFGSSESPGDAAIDLIEGDDMVELLGLGPITDASCIDPEGDEVGTVFPCTASTSEAELEFSVEIDREDHIFASPTNVLSVEALNVYALSAINAMNDQNELTLAEDSLSCGEETVVLDASNEVLCTLTDPGNGDEYDAIITITDRVERDFSIDVASEPRS